MIWIIIFAVLILADLFTVSTDRYTWSGVLTATIIILGGWVYYETFFNSGLIATLPGIEPGFSWKNVFVLFVYYFAAGATWSIFKWYFHVQKYVDKLLDEREEFMSGPKRFEYLGGMVAKYTSDPRGIATSFYDRINLKSPDYDTLKQDQYFNVFVNKGQSPGANALADQMLVQLRTLSIASNSHKIGSVDTTQIRTLADILDANKIREMIAPSVTQNTDRMSFWIINWPISILSTFFHDFVIRLVDHLKRWLRNTYKAITRFAMRRV